MITIEERVKDRQFVTGLPATRALAKEQKSMIYYTGIPCVRGHDSYRKTANGSCAKCASLASHKLQQALPKEVVQEYRRRANLNWNASDAGKTAKRRWKDRDPVWAWVISAVGGARTRARKSGVPFNITNEYIHAIYTGVCPVLGAQLVVGTGRTHKFSPSIDKFVPELGYVEGNVAIVSHRANAIKSDASAEEIEKVLNWVKKEK